MTSRDNKTMAELIKEDKEQKKEMIRKSIQWIKRRKIKDVIFYPFEFPVILICAMEMAFDYVEGVTK